MNELWSHLSFTKPRFHCSKQQGPTFHVTTVTNSTGEAVVQYFSGQSDVSPDACGSFVENDNSRLAGACDQWRNGYDIWSWRRAHEARLYIALIFFKYSWFVNPDYSVLKCDDNYSGVSSVGDFWKVFVR